MVYLDLILNLSLLVALTVVSGFIEKRWVRHSAAGLWLQGFLFGTVAVIGMLRPLDLGAGLIFDGRSVMLSLCALFYGPWAGSLAAGMAIFCRLLLGGMGQVMGVLVILSSLTIGLFGYARLKPYVKPPSVLQLYLFGLVVHVAMLAMTFTLPGNTALPVLMRIGIPVMLFYPLATVFAGKILSDQVMAVRTMADLQEAKQNLSITLDSIGDAVISTNLTGEIVLMNPVAEALTGWTHREALGAPLSEVFRIIDEKTGNAVEDPVKRVLARNEVLGLANHTVLIAKNGIERPISDSAAPIRNARKEIIGVVLVFRDQSEQRRLMQLMQARLRLLEYAATHTLDEVLGKALDETGELVHSPVGFYHFVEADQSTPSFQQRSVTTLTGYRKPGDGSMHHAIDQAGAWLDCVRQKRPVVHNDCASLRNGRGLPEGQVQLARELVAPIIRGNKVVAVMGVGNKSTDYTEKDLEIVSYMVDITWHIVEQKRAEEALLESETLFRNLFERHTAVKLIIDPDSGDIVDANDAAEQYYGWPKGRLRQMKIYDINTLPPEEVKQAMEKARSLQRVHFELSHLRADGLVRDVEVFSSKIEVKGKDLLHSIVHDITERKQTEAERLRLLAAIEQTGEMIMVTNEKGEIEYVNPAFERMTGYSREEVLGRDPRFLTSGEQDEVLYRNLWETVSDGRTWQGRLSNKRKDGVLYTQDVTISPVRDASGHIINYVAVNRDVTEELRLQAQLLQAQRMESVGRLAGGVAHDFNNMLGVIIGHAEMALNEVDSSHPVFDDLKEILTAAHRSANLTSQLLAFARKQTIRPRVLDFNETVEGMFKMLRRLIGEDIELLWKPGANLWPVKVDPTQVDQVLANLCVNARDAIADVGKVTIETGNMEFDEAYCREHAGFIPGKYVMLAVSDDGCGMDNEVLANLFEPFFTTKEVGKGTGLGLPTVYGIVKQNSGFINVYSEPGQGTTVKLYFPKTDLEPSAKESRPKERKKLEGSETILLVEDEESILDLGRSILEQHGYLVLTARSPVEALNLAKIYGDPIHLLITDVVMPGMNGKDLVERLRAVKPGFKCIFMSGYTANVIAHWGILDEGISFLQKPFSVKAIAEKVRDVLES